MSISNGEIMRTRLLLIIILSIVTQQSTSLASDSLQIDGNFLMRACSHINNTTLNGQDLAKVNFTDGYCMGIVDGISFMSIGINAISPSTQIPNLRVCWPKNLTITLGQKIRILTKYLRDHPEMLAYDGHLLVNLAFRNAYPCE